MKKNKKIQRKNFNYKKILLIISCIILFATLPFLFTQRKGDFEVLFDKKFIKDVCFNSMGLSIEDFYLKKGEGETSYVVKIKNNRDFPAYNPTIMLVDDSSNEAHEFLTYLFIPPYKTVTYEQNYLYRDFKSKFLNKKFFPCLTTSRFYDTPTIFNFFDKEEVEKLKEKDVDAYKEYQQWLKSLSQEERDKFLKKFDLE